LLQDSVAGPEGVYAFSDGYPNTSKGNSIAIGSRLFFAGLTSAEGLEPWAVDMVGVGGPLIWADFNWTGAELGSQPNPYRTLAGGLNVVDAGGTVRIKPGATNATPRIAQQVRLEASGGTVRIGGL
jgi:hypothetical protein